MALEAQGSLPDALLVCLMQIYPFQVPIRSECHKMARGNLMQKNTVVPQKIVGITWKMCENLGLFFYPECEVVQQPS